MPNFRDLFPQEADSLVDHNTSNTDNIEYWCGTQAEYNAIGAGNYDDNTIYTIVDTTTTGGGGGGGGGGDSLWDNIIDAYTRSAMNISNTESSPTVSVAGNNYQEGRGTGYLTLPSTPSNNDVVVFGIIPSGPGDITIILNAGTNRISAGGEFGSTTSFTAVSGTDQYWAAFFRSTTTAPDVGGSGTSRWVVISLLPNR